MNNVKTALTITGLALALVGCGGGGSGGSSNDAGNTGETAVEKSFTVSLANVEVARTADGMPVMLETSDIQSGGMVTIRQ